MPRRHRTTARSILALLVLWVSAGTASAGVPRFDFPVVGVNAYYNDWHAPRSGGRLHEGNDIMAKRWAPVVAVENGRVYRPSWSSRDCALILEGDSGTEYWYLHLNNDRTMANDNSGGCRRGISFAPTLAKRADVRVYVRVGQLIGYVGNSGNANGTSPHLHFEVHPGGADPTNPYPYLQEAPRLLFPVPSYAKGYSFRVTIKGRFENASRGRLGVWAGSVRVPYIRETAIKARYVRFIYGNDIVVRRRTRSGVDDARLANARAGERVAVWTGYVAVPRDGQLARPDVMVASKLELRGS